ncbi:MAG: M10 family metallopeptidase C-terminal domain-containing protein [Rhodobacteraceae bacterium]|nr:M10 family metallopeptidase C-terminal domain-containing protein [Paracoccaceae bacterium]
MANIIKGTSGNDGLIGGEGDDIIIGGEGDDFMIGRGGNDTFVFEPGHGNDYILGFEAGNDIIDLTAFSEQLTWEALSEKFSTGYNFIFGNYVEIDLTEWGGGKIQIWGVNSIDDLTPEMFSLRTSPLTLEGTDSSDSLHGDWGDDTISGGDAGDYLYGHQGSDTLKGGAGNDFIAGGQGDDTIIGGEGDDTLYGDGYRSDEVYSDGTPTGETDKDTFVFSPDSGNDIIKDFNDGEDLIDLTAFTNISGFNDINASQVGNNVVIRFSGDNSITLSNFDLSDLDASDFVFHDTSTMTDSM